MKEGKFNEKEYKNNYDKEKYKHIHFKLKPDEYEKFKKNISDANTDMTSFFRKCINNFEKIIKNF